MPSVAQRFPLREVAFALGIVVIAGFSSYASGRSKLPAELVRPFLVGVDTGWSAVRGGAGFFQDLDSLKRQNSDLQARVFELERELVRRQEAQFEAERLRALVGLNQRVTGPTRSARVIGRSPDNWHSRAYLDKGGKEGVRIDAVVLAPQGLVGRVMSSGSHTSEVALLTDPGNQVSCLDQRSRSPGVLVGEGEATLVVQYLQQQVDFRIGDTVITSGYGGIYPKGLPVGKVARVARQPNGITPLVAVVPEVDLDRIEEVMILDPVPGSFQ